MTANEQTGRKALSYFHDASSKYANYNISFDDLLFMIGGKKPEIFTENFGSTILDLRIRSGFSESDLKDSMESLADVSQGRVPQFPHATFFQALSTQIQSASFINAVKYTVTESASDIATGAQEIGNSIIFSGKFLVYLLPVAVIGIVAFVALNPERTADLIKKVR